MRIWQMKAIDIVNFFSQMFLPTTVVNDHGIRRNILRGGEDPAARKQWVDIRCPFSEWRAINSTNT